MTPHDEDDAARDPHLLAALRHAPDRDAAPPPQVTARILAAARAAVELAAPPSWAQRLASWWRQPPLGAAFGTLMAALLVGLLWSTQEPPPTSPESRVAAPAPAPFGAAAPSAAAQPAPAVERDAGMAASRDRPGATADASRDAVATPPARPAPAAKTEAPRRPAEPAPGNKARVDQRAAQQRSEAADPAIAAALPQPAPTTAPSADASTRPAPPGERAAAVPQSVPQPAPGATAALPPESMRQDQAQEQRAANDAKALRGRAADRLGGRAEPREGADAAASTPMPSALGGLAKGESAAVDPLARFEATMAAPDAALRASWRGAAGTARAVPHGAAQQTWWRELRAATQGRWQRVPTPPPGLPWLTLTIDGFDRARWWLDGEHLVLADATDGSAWRVPITQAQRRAWSEAIAGW